MVNACVITKTYLHFFLPFPSLFSFPFPRLLRRLSLLSSLSSSYIFFYFSSFFFYFLLAAFIFVSSSSSSSFSTTVLSLCSQCIDFFPHLIFFSPPLLLPLVFFLFSLLLISHLSFIL